MSKGGAGHWPEAAAACAAAGLPVVTGEPMSRHTTFRLGGPAPLFVRCGSAEQLIAAAAILRGRRLPWFLLGGGSNLLVSDAGPECAVLQFASSRAEVARLDAVSIRVDADAPLDGVAAACCRLGLGDFVQASGIPGTVGGAIVGNAGAFGWQMADALMSVEVLLPDGAVSTIPRRNLHFAYRDSELKGSGRIVLAATFALPEASPDSLLAERQRLLDLRREKHPDLATTPCAGSFFRNIEPTSKADRRQAAGWFLEQAGAKNMTVGGAAVFERHANIPIARSPGCRAADIQALTCRMAAAVESAFGLRLVPEVLFVGPFEGPLPGQTAPAAP